MGGNESVSENEPNNESCDADVPGRGLYQRSRSGSASTAAATRPS